MLTVYIFILEITSYFNILIGTLFRVPKSSKMTILTTSFSMISSTNPEINNSLGFSNKIGSSIGICIIESELSND